MPQISIEQAPDGTDPDLAAFLERFFFDLNSSLNNVDLLPRRNILPNKPEIGRIYYFNVAILPSITSEGYWGYTSAGWTQLG